LHRYRRRYLLVKLEGESIQEPLKEFPFKAKIIKAEGGHVVLKADGQTIDSLRIFVTEKGFETISTSGTIKGLFRKSKRLNRPSSQTEMG